MFLVMIEMCAKKPKPEMQSCGCNGVERMLVACVGSLK